ncbi:MAG: MarR family transcriptional regulator [Deltaproteobacteria bacterium]|nr:MarR family transcriptional regulator [Deltaproteobacteria bacterium]
MDNLQLAPIIIGKLLNISGMLQRHGNSITQPFGLNQQQFAIFFEIANAGKVKQKDMVNRLLLEKAHVSKVVKKLHKMELITITASDEDKRSAWLAPTPEGKQILEKCRGEFRKWHKEWTEAVDEKQLNSILDNLSYLQAVFEDKLIGGK